MNTPVVRPSGAASPPTKAGKRRQAVTEPPPGAATVAARLAGLTGAAMPFLSKHVDLTPADGGPEVIGGAVAPPPGRP